MKVGDYVRTKDYQNIRSRIGKIIRQDGKYYYLDIDENTQMAWEKDTILTSSPNIIDLIQVGDIVNGYKVDFTNIENKLTYEEKNIGFYDGDGDITLFENDIKSIVTKEQFKSIEYEVE